MIRAIALTLLIAFVSSFTWAQNSEDRKKLLDQADKLVEASFKQASNIAMQMMVFDFLSYASNVDSLTYVQTMDEAHTSLAEKVDELRGRLYGLSYQYIAPQDWINFVEEIRQVRLDLDTLTRRYYSDVAFSEQLQFFHDSYLETWKDKCELGHLARFEGMKEASEFLKRQWNFKADIRMQGGVGVDWSPNSDSNSRVFYEYHQSDPGVPLNEENERNFKILENLKRAIYLYEEEQKNSGDSSGNQNDGSDLLIYIKPFIDMYQERIANDAIVKFDGYLMEAKERFFNRQANGFDIADIYAAKCSVDEVVLKQPSPLDIASLSDEQLKERLQGKRERMHKALNDLTGLVGYVRFKESDLIKACKPISQEEEAGLVECVNADGANVIDCFKKTSNDRYCHIGEQDYYLILNESLATFNRDKVQSVSIEDIDASKMLEEADGIVDLSAEKYKRDLQKPLTAILEMGVHTELIIRKLGQLVTNKYMFENRGAIKEMASSLELQSLLVVVERLANDTFYVIMTDELRVNLDTDIVNALAEISAKLSEPKKWTREARRQERILHEAQSALREMLSILRLQR